MGTSQKLMTKIALAEVERRLEDWNREWGGGKYATLGFSTGQHVLSKLVTFGGFLPSGGGSPTGGCTLTSADEVENIVRRLAKGWPAHAMVLRCDYFQPSKAMDARLDWLRSRGTKIGKNQYYQMLESAKLFVAGSL